MKKLSLALAGLALIATPALADNTDTANVTVNGTIIAPLTISATTALQMPHVVRPKTSLTSGPAGPSGGTSTVTVACGTTTTPTAVTYGPGANPFASGVAGATTVSTTSANLVGANSTGTCASVTVTGQAGYSFLPAVGSGSIAITGLPTGVTGTAACPTASTQLVSGTATLHCGASIAVSTTASAGTYSGTFPVTVTYD